MHVTPSPAGEAKEWKTQIHNPSSKSSGTSFNVNSYPDEPNIATTLLQGSIKIVNKKSSQILQPGQQLQLNNHGLFQLIKSADTDQGYIMEKWRI